MIRARLFLITPDAAEPASLIAPVAAALNAGEAVASVLIAGAPSDDSTRRDDLKRLIATIQQAGAAALLPPPTDLRQVARLGADGVHWTAGGQEPEADARALVLLSEAMRADRITGAGGLASRDGAMAAGEAEVDYVMFGEPTSDGGLPPLPAVIDRCQWWAEVFMVPAVGYAPGLDAVEAIARTGIEFVALGAAVFAAPEGPAAAVRVASAALDHAAGKAQEPAPSPTPARTGPPRR
jgi:thiamine-phosphate pyrophosphorylase